MDYTALRERWEAAVHEEPAIAFQSGPPNWLVKEQQRKGEDFLDAANRVKAEYFSKSVTPTVSVTLCPVCGVTPLRGRQKVCSGACRVKQSRNRG